MPSTTNFGWTTPADTDLVKDGASAIRTLGNGIDTTLVDLKGGTTGQVLSKNSNTDMDFTWVAQDDSNAIQNALLTTTGDTIYASGASTPARLGIGSSGQVLTVSGGLPTWATPAAGGGLTLLSTTALSGVTTTVSGISGSYKQLLIRVYDGQWGTGGQQVRIYPNGASNNVWAGGVYSGSTSVAQIQGESLRSLSNQDNTGGGWFITVLIDNYASTKRKPFWYNGAIITSGSIQGHGYGGTISATSAITSIAVTGGNSYSFTAGTIDIYGVN